MSFKNAVSTLFFLVAAAHAQIPEPVVEEVDGSRFRHDMVEAQKQKERDEAQALEEKKGQKGGYQAQAERAIGLMETLGKTGICDPKICEAAKFISERVLAPRKTTQKYYGYDGGAVSSRNVGLENWFGSLLERSPELVQHREEFTIRTLTDPVERELLVARQSPEGLTNKPKFIERSKTNYLSRALDISGGNPVKALTMLASLGHDDIYQFDSESDLFKMGNLGPDFVVSEDIQGKMNRAFKQCEELNEPLGNEVCPHGGKAYNYHMITAAWLGCELAKEGFDQVKIPGLMVNSVMRLLGTQLAGDNPILRDYLNQKKQSDGKYCVDLCVDFPVGASMVYKTLTHASRFTEDAKILKRAGYTRAFQNLQKPKDMDDERFKKAKANLDLIYSDFEYTLDRYAVGAREGAKLCRNYAQSRGEVGSQKLGYSTDSSGTAEKSRTVDQIQKLFVGSLPVYGSGIAEGAEISAAYFRELVDKVGVDSALEFVKKEKGRQISLLVPKVFPDARAIHSLFEDIIDEAIDKLSDSQKIQISDYLNKAGNASAFPMLSQHIQYIEFSRIDTPEKLFKYHRSNPEMSEQLLRSLNVQSEYKLYQTPLGIPLVYPADKDLPPQLAQVFRKSRIIMSNLIQVMGDSSSQLGASEKLLFLEVILSSSLHKIWTNSEKLIVQKTLDEFLAGVDSAFLEQLKVNEIYSFLNLLGSAPGRIPEFSKHKEKLRKAVQEGLPKLREKLKDPNASYIVNELEAFASQ
jgi:hypothetical protein